MLCVFHVVRREDFNMARGRKKLSLDEQLEQIIIEIQNTENSLNEMKQKKKELEEKIKQQQLNELNDLIAAKGLTFDEVKRMLENKE